MEGLKKNKKLLIFVIVVFVLGISLVVYKNVGGGVNNSEYVLDNALYSEGNKDNIDVKNGEGGVNENNENGSVTKIYIHVAGEVNCEGIVVLDEGARIVDAIEKAGGITGNGDLSKVNLAYKLLDGQKVYIPSFNDKADEYNVVSSEYGNLNNRSNFNELKKVGDKVNINTATQTELETLTGIGPSLAEKIIQYRKKNGSFKKVEELKNVSGIGDNKFESIKDEVIAK